MRITLTIALATLLIACGGQPEKEQVAAAETAGEDVPELNLNLPGPDCACQVEQDNYTFLERGLQSIEERAYLEALQYFQRYQRIEKSELAAVESGIAIAYLSILPDSPIFDRDAARDAYTRLQPRITDDMKLHTEVQLMQASMDSFLDMYTQVDRLKQTNFSLRAELEKREEAIKRLRDLTLGREPEAAGLLGN
ncbi:MAG: hypothetical protein V2I66_00580 [Halieaceae bacterium]|jgi:hypothetical protein|nr:hypothetical protein [Halieaceae bacterium]